MTLFKQAFLPITKALVFPSDGGRNDNYPRIQLQNRWNKKSEPDTGTNVWSER